MTELNLGTYATKPPILVEILRPQLPLSGKNLKGSRPGSMARMAETPRFKVPEFEVGHWSFFPCRPVLSELWISQISEQVSNQLTNIQ